jgi:hypothetical protein
MMKFLPGLRHDTANRPVTSTQPGSSGWRNVLHLVVLTTFAVTQPAYDRLGGNPGFLGESGLAATGVLLLAAVVSLLVPLTVALPVWAIGRIIPRAQSSVFALALFVLFALIALPVVKRLEFMLPAWLLTAAALALAGAAVWLYFAFRRFRSVVSVAAPAIIIFPALFLLHSPVSAIFSAPREIHTAHWNPVPVVMVVLDELRGTSLVNDRNEIDAARFPGFAELARDSTWYRNATTVHHETMYAVPAMLSGRLPATHWLPRPSDLPQNLFSLVAATGAYEWAVFEPVSQLATPWEASDFVSIPLTRQMVSVMSALSRVLLVHVVPSSFQSQLPEVPPLWFGLHVSRQIDRSRHRGTFKYHWGQDRRGQFEHFLDCLDDSPQPALFFNHVLLPHVPWCYLPSGRRYLPESDQWELLNFDTHSDILDFWGTDDLYVVQSQQRQILQLEYTDRLVGKLLDRLRETGLFDKCLLIVTADHGISFRTGGARRSPTHDNLADIMAVPLFVKLPGQKAGTVSDRNVESIDILPTIADVLGIELNLPVDGHSMLDESIAERRQKTMYVNQQPTVVPATVVADRPVVNDVLSRFGRASDVDTLYRIGPDPELVGRSVDSFSLTADAPVSLELIRLQTAYSTDPDALVPCYFEGRVSAPVKFETPVRLAVAVNGAIRASTRTYLLDGIRDRWAAMVPEAAFHDGENDVQFFVISGESPDLRLTRCVARPGATPAKKP